MYCKLYDNFKPQFDFTQTPTNGEPTDRTERLQATPSIPGTTTNGQPTYRTERLQATPSIPGTTTNGEPTDRTERPQARQSIPGTTTNGEPTYTTERPQATPSIPRTNSPILIVLSEEESLDIPTAKPKATKRKRTHDGTVPDPKCARMGKSNEMTTISTTDRELFKNPQPSRIQTARKHTGKWNHTQRNRQLQTARKHTAPVKGRKHQKEFQAVVQQQRNRQKVPPKANDLSHNAKKQYENKEEDAPSQLMNKPIGECCDSSLTNTRMLQQPKNKEMVESPAPENATKHYQNKEQSGTQGSNLPSDVTTTRKTAALLHGQGETYKPGTTFSSKIYDPEYLTFRGNCCRSIATQTKVRGLLNK